MSRELRRALAELTNCFLEKHGCFPLDNPRWNAAMKEAYRLIGNPYSGNRVMAMAKDEAMTMEQLRMFFIAALCTIEPGVDARRGLTDEEIDRLIRSVVPESMIREEADAERA